MFVYGDQFSAPFHQPRHGRQEAARQRDWKCPGTPPTNTGLGTPRRPRVLQLSYPRENAGRIAKTTSTANPGALRNDLVRMARRLAHPARSPAVGGGLHGHRNRVQPGLQTSLPFFARLQRSLRFPAVQRSDHARHPTDPAGRRGEFLAIGGDISRPQGIRMKSAPLASRPNQTPAPTF